MLATSRILSCRVSWLNSKTAFCPIPGTYAREFLNIQLLSQDSELNPVRIALPDHHLATSSRLTGIWISVQHTAPILCSDNIASIIMKTSFCIMLWTSSTSVRGNDKNFLTPAALWPSQYIFVFVLPCRCNENEERWRICFILHLCNQCIDLFILHFLISFPTYPEIHQVHQNSVTCYPQCCG